MLAQLQKPAVQMLLFGVAVVGAVGFFFAQSQQTNEPKKDAPPPVPGMGQAAAATVDVPRDKVKVTETTTSRPVERLELPSVKPEPPTIAKEQPKQEQKPPVPAFPNLVQMSGAAQPKPFTPRPPKVFAPRGTLIKAALVITLESNAVGTPILGMVTEDVYFQGDLIVPAGTQVQAEAMANSSFRDRIDVRGTYTFTWADGSEYKINAIALDHQVMPDGTFSLTDGSPGIHGRVLKTDEYAEFKLLVAEAVKGLMNNQQSQYQTVYGLVPENTNRNASLGAGSSSASAYANLLSKRIEKDLEYVQVPAGTSFYIYTLDLFEPELRSIAGIRQGNKAITGLDEQKASHEGAVSAAAMSESEMRKRLDEARSMDEARVKAQKQADEIARTRALLAPSASAPTKPIGKP